MTNIEKHIKKVQEEMWIDIQKHIDKQDRRIEVKLQRTYHSNIRKLRVMAKNIRLYNKKTRRGVLFEFALLKWMGRYNKKYKWLPNSMSSWLRCWQKYEHIKDFYQEFEINRNMLTRGTQYSTISSDKAHLQGKKRTKSYVKPLREY